MHLGHLSLGEVVLPQAPADRSHVGFGDGKPQRGEHVRGPVRGALARTEEGISTTRSVAPGATACTCSRSPASSPVASHGEAEPPRLVTTSIRAAGSRNVRSKLARSRRISVGPAFGGGTGATTVTVSPRPSIPLSSNGWMPYATRYCCGEKQGPSWQYKGAPDGAATVDAAPRRHGRGHSRAGPGCRGRMVRTSPAPHHQDPGREGCDGDQARSR